MSYVCGSNIVHHLNGTELNCGTIDLYCALLTCIMHNLAQDDFACSLRALTVMVHNTMFSV